jgi:hypothetical protein
MGTAVSVASKELECGRLRLKTGKTRCLPRCVDSKWLREILWLLSGRVVGQRGGGQGIGIERGRKSRGRGGIMASTTGETVACQYGKVKCFAVNGRK